MDKYVIQFVMNVKNKIIVAAVLINVEITIQFYFII